MVEFRACPFCGGEAVVSRCYNTAAEWFLCFCPKCHVSQTGNEYRSKFEAVEAWNRRVNDTPVRYGSWIGEGDGYADGELVYDVWHCSECDYCIDDGTDDPELLLKYCPGCGAKMDGGNENG